MDRLPAIKVDLSGTYKIKDVGVPAVIGHIGADSGLQQLDAFLGVLRSAIVDSPTKLTGELAQAIRYASDKASAAGRLLSLNIDSSLDQHTKSISYSFTIKTTDKVDHG